MSPLTRSLFQEWKAKLRETEGVSSDSVEAMLKQMEDLEKEKETTEVDQPSLPCLIGMCGSGTGFMKVRRAIHLVHTSSITCYLEPFPLFA